MITIKALIEFEKGDNYSLARVHEVILNDEELAKLKKALSEIEDTHAPSPEAD